MLLTILPAASRTEDGAILFLRVERRGGRSGCRRCPWGVGQGVLVIGQVFDPVGSLSRLSGNPPICKNQLCHCDIWFVLGHS